MKDYKDKMIEVLKDNIKRSNFFFDNLPDLVFVFEIDKNGIPAKFIEVNDKFCNELKYKKKEILKLSVSDIFSLDSIEMLEEQILSLLENKQIKITVNLLDKENNNNKIEINSYLKEFNGHKLLLNIGRRRDVNEKNISY